MASGTEMALDEPAGERRYRYMRRAETGGENGGGTGSFPIGLDVTSWGLALNCLGNNNCDNF